MEEPVGSINWPELRAELVESGDEVLIEAHRNELMNSLRTQGTSAKPGEIDPTSIESAAPGRTETLRVGGNLHVYRVTQDRETFKGCVLRSLTRDGFLAQNSLGVNILTPEGSPFWSDEPTAVDAVANS
jgi:hypothetical protein